MVLLRGQDDPEIVLHKDERCGGNGDATTPESGAHLRSRDGLRIGIGHPSPRGPFLTKLYRRQINPFINGRKRRDGSCLRSGQQTLFYGVSRGTGRNQGFKRDQPATRTAARMAGQRTQTQRLAWVAMSPMCSPPMRSSATRQTKGPRASSTSRKRMPGPGSGLRRRPPSILHDAERSHHHAASVLGHGTVAAGLLAGERREQIAVGSRRRLFARSKPDFRPCAAQFRRSHTASSKRALKPRRHTPSQGLIIAIPRCEA